MRIKYRVNAKNIEKLRKWHAKNEEAKAQKRAHPFQYYSPFITIDEVNSISRRHLYFCPVQKRNIHLLSDGEANAYKHLIFNKTVIGIREQFPLHLPNTLKIAKKLKLIHPRNWKTKELYIMTTDLLVDRVDLETGELFQEAYNFKYFDSIYERTETGEITKKSWRTWQKAEIEQVYWQEKGISCYQMTEKDSSKIGSQNITWFQMCYDLDTSIDEIKNFKKAFINSYLHNPRALLETHLQHVSAELYCSTRKAQFLFQYAAFHQLIKVNIEVPVRLAKPVAVAVELECSV